MRARAVDPSSIRLRATCNSKHKDKARRPFVQRLEGSLALSWVKCDANLNAEDIKCKKYNRNIQHAICNVQHATYCMQHATGSVQKT